MGKKESAIFYTVSVLSGSKAGGVKSSSNFTGLQYSSLAGAKKAGVMRGRGGHR